MSDSEVIDTALIGSDEVIKDYEDTETAEAFILAFILALILGANKSKNIFVNNNLKALILKKKPSLAKLFNKNTFTPEPKVKEYLNNIFGTDYKGIKFTTNNKLEELKKQLATAKDLKAFVKERNAELKKTTENIVKQNTTAILAEENGFEWATAITRRDLRVRDSHRKNDGRFWKIEDYKPWQDYNCRCTYTYYKNKPS